jgi:ABC-2 type transport system permease protein
MNNPIWLIIQREYLTRVKKKSFLLTTLLVPFLPIAVGMMQYLIFSYKDKEPTLIVKDETGWVLPALQATNKVKYLSAQGTLEQLKLQQKNISSDTVLLYIPQPTSPQAALAPQIISNTQLGEALSSSTAKDIENIYFEKKLKEAGINPQQIAEFNTPIKIENLVNNVNKSKTNQTATIISGIAGLMLYFMLILYGMMVMRGVMEEKTNRISEVLISSVKPFQLLLGKIVGIAMVALTQLLLWGLLFKFLYIILPLISPTFNTALGNGMFATLSAQLGADFNWALIIGAFIFYFTFGYLLYASLFAAVGSAVNEDQAEAQTLTLPITVPIIIAIYIATHAVQYPNSNLSFWGSIIPFTSPIVMIARINFDVPLWQLILSMALLVLTFLVIVYIASRIYRVGILMYGKKPTLLELAKWIFKKTD